MTGTSFGGTIDDFQFPIDFLDLSARGHKGLGVTSTFTLNEGECITFVLRQTPTTTIDSEDKSMARTALNPPLTHEFLDHLIEDTTAYWIKWIGQCTYTGSYSSSIEKYLTEGVLLQVDGANSSRGLRSLSSYSHSHQRVPSSPHRRSPFPRISTELDAIGTTGRS